MNHLAEDLQTSWLNSSASVVGSISNQAKFPTSRTRHVKDELGSNRRREL